MSGLQGARVIVVGASAGIGRATAAAAVERGASVVFAARRADKLDEAVTEAGGGTAVPTDVTRPADCERLVEAAIAAMGGIDVILYATGVAPLRRLRDTSADDLAWMFATNVFGLNAVVSAAIPHLEPGAIVSAMSSESVVNPRPGVAAYGASKASLEALVTGWRNEHPRIRFGVIGVGSTVPTEFGNEFDAELLGELFVEWMRLGMLQEGFMETPSVGAAVADILAAVWPHPSVGMEHLLLRPPFPVVGDTSAVEAAASENQIGV